MKAASQAVEERLGVPERKIKKKSGQAVALVISAVLS